MVLSVGNILDTVQQRQLVALQRTARTLDDVQLRLATGRRVNSAIDDPQNFFASESLKNRAADISRLLDGIGQNVRAIEEAEIGLKAAERILDQAEAWAILAELELFSGEAETETVESDNFTRLEFTGPGDFINYSGAQDSGAPVSIIEGGDGVSLDGNLWKRYFVDYDITADTVLEFEFRSGNIPEIAAIGFDNDNTFTNSSSQFFLYGTQLGGIAYSAPIPTYQYDGSGDWVTVEIPVGTFFTGNFSHLTFISDDDAAPNDGQSQYRNIILREGEITEAEINPAAARFQEGYDSILRQLDLLVEDTDYRGINLLNNEDAVTYFNEERTNKLETEGIDATSLGLGLENIDFSSQAQVRASIASIREARETLRSYAASLSTDLSIVKTRENFARTTINSLLSGSDDLTLADLNEEGANLLALQTRQQIQFASFTPDTLSIVDLL